MKLILLSIFALSAVGCTRHIVNYKLKFDEIQPTADSDNFATAATILEAKDEFMSIEIGPITSGIVRITVKNKSLKPVSILWDQTTLIDDGGATRRIFHSGIKFVDVEKAMVPTIIPPNSTHSDSIVPADSITGWQKNGGWIVNSRIFGIPENSSSKEKLENVHRATPGKKLKLFLTTSYDGKIVHRTYSMKVDSIVVR